MTRWNDMEDAKLVHLWRTPHNSVDPTKLDITCACKAKYIPATKYVNCAWSWQS
jgi:hypothetical protein